MNNHFTQLSAVAIVAFGSSAAHAGVLPGPLVDA
ncbi:hypothetical protein M2244_001748 [Rhodoferax antarcticus]|nr:hypothetical protein [Rhodoferax antarcticus]